MIAFKNNSTILFYAGILSILASINSCTHTTEKQINKSIAAEKGFFEVNAVGQTQPVESSDDAADDPAIWVNSADVSKSTIIGTDKQKGLVVYNLDGKELYGYPVGRVNNVDVRSGFIFGEDTISIVAATNRSYNSISYFKVIPETGELTILSLDSYFSKSEEVYGFALCLPVNSNKLYAISVDTDGLLEQWSVGEKDGNFHAMRVRSVRFESKCEGIVADDELGFIYVGEEEFGIWKLKVDPTTGDEKELIADLTNNNLEPDIEGLAIYYAANSQGYLIASSQGNNSFAVFERKGEYNYLGSFMIVHDQIDGTSETDGIDVLNLNLGPKFPNGIFIAQDGYNFKDGQLVNQCFKLVDWKEIAGKFNPNLLVDPEYKIMR